MTEKELNDHYGGRLVCETVDPEFGALLESAPDLYRALQALVEVLESGWPLSGSAILTLADQGQEALDLADADA